MTTRPGLPAHQMTTGNVANRKAPWFGVGSVLDTDASIDEVLAAADLDFEIEKVQAYANGLEIPGQHGLVRTDTGAPLPVSVGDQYTPYQNRSLVTLGNEFVRNHGATWESGGIFDDGRTAYLALRVPELDVDLSGDTTEGYLFLMNGHGTTSVQGRTVMQRLMCTNQLGALSGRAENWSVRHTTRVTDMAASAASGMRKAIAGAETFAATAKHLADVDMELTEIREFINSLAPMPEDAKARTRSRVTRERNGMFMNVMSTETVSDELRRTAWGVFNGVTEYAEHLRPMRADRRRPMAERQLRSRMLSGPADTLGRRAARDLLALAA